MRVRCARTFFGSPTTALKHVARRVSDALEEAAHGCEAPGPERVASARQDAERLAYALRPRIRRELAKLRDLRVELLDESLNAG